MIKLTRLNHEPLVVNLYAIQYVEATPDTAIAFTNGEKILVEETVDEVVELAKSFLREVIAKGE